MCQPLVRNESTLMHVCYMKFFFHHRLKFSECYKLMNFFSRHDVHSKTSNMAENADSLPLDESKQKWSHVALQELVSPRFRTDRIPIHRIFLARYTEYPCAMSCFHSDKNGVLHVTTILKYMSEKFGHNPNNDIVVRDYHDATKQYFVK